MTDEERNMDFSVLAKYDVEPGTLFEVLKSPRRRFTISCLQSHDYVLTLPDIADELATWENNANITDIAAEEVKSTYLDLYHVHIPKLEDAGFVEYDQDGDMVRLTEDMTDLVRQLNVAGNSEL